jgi:hypothetical protein
VSEARQARPPADAGPAAEVEQAGGAGGVADELARLRRDVERLQARVAELSRRCRFEELEVERLNVVEPDGTLRLVASNRVRAPDAAVDGRTFKRQGGNPPGLLFYNDEGDECGGLIFGGRRRDDGGCSAGAHLLFDQYKQDQAIGIQYDDSNGERRLGLFVSDWAVVPGATRLQLIDRWEAVRSLPQGPRRAQAMEELRAAGFFPAPRLFVGRTREGAAVVRLCDARGRVRLRLAVDPEGVPSIEFLDEAGQVVLRLPGAAPAEPTSLDSSVT